MKKSLIALAALSAFATAAQAQSSVSVYGLIDMGYSDVSNKASLNGVEGANTSRTSTGNGDGGLATSRLGFQGSEDLGGGNKANFRLEYDLVDVGAGANTFGARESWVGLESKTMGQVKLGRQWSSIHYIVTGGSTGGANNTAGAVYSGAGPDTANASGIRPHQIDAQKAITYISPNFAGFTAEVQFAKTKDTTSNVGAGTRETQDEGKQQGGSLKYAAGKLNLAYGYQQVKRSDTIATVEARALAATTLSTDTAFRMSATDGNATKSTVHAFTGNYDLGVAKLFAMHVTTKADASTIATGALNAAGNSKQDVTEIGAQFPVGKTVLWASMYDGSWKNNANPAVDDKDDLEGFQIGARYDLSKRTALYAIYGEQERKGTGVANRSDNVKSTGMSAGVRHTF
jgi:predicted porin